MAGVVPAGMVSTDAKAPEMIQRGSRAERCSPSSAALDVCARDIGEGRGVSSASFWKLNLLIR